MKTKTFILLLSLVIATLSCTPSNVKESEEWALVLHGGAGSSSGKISEEKRAQYEAALREASQIGSKMLSEGRAALDVVEEVVSFLEDSPLFNAGKGAVKTLAGLYELDAAIMDGSNLEAGAVAGIRDVKNPIKLARAVMDSTIHLFLIGEGASSFAKEMGLEMVENSYFSTPKREAQLEKILKKEEKENLGGTVGCVAKDREGNLAAATSTGGMSGKKWGRVGDVPVIGAGTYANNSTVAVSGTGHGEVWIRRVVAYDISALYQYRSLSLQEAVEEVIYNKVQSMGGSGGGVIAVDREGNISMEFNTDLMYRAWANSSGEEGVAILKGDQKVTRKER